MRTAIRLVLRIQSRSRRPWSARDTGICGGQHPGQGWNASDIPRGTPRCKAGVDTAEAEGAGEDDESEDNRAECKVGGLGRPGMQGGWHYDACCRVARRSRGGNQR